MESLYTKMWVTYHLTGQGVINMIEFSQEPFLEAHQIETNHMIQESENFEFLYDLNLNRILISHVKTKKALDPPVNFG